MKVSRAAMAIVFAAALSLIANDVMAQRGGGGGRRGGPGGGGPGGGGQFGGGGGQFGGGGQLGGGGRGGAGGSLVGLLRIEEVQEELEMMPDQVEAVQKLASQRPDIERPEGFDPRDRSEEGQAARTEMIEKMRKQMEDFAAKQSEQLEEVLFPEQMERLKQIQVQAMGIQALMDEEVGKKLKLTSDQKDQLTEMSRNMRDEVRDQMRELFQGGGGGGEDMRAKIEELRKGVEDKVLNVLTSDQKKEFEEMKGEPFEMPQAERGRRGGGGQGGGGRFGGGRGGDRGGDRGGRGGRPGGGGRPDGDRGGIDF